MTPEQKAKELYTDHENMFAAKRLGFLAGYQYAQECRREELENIIGDAWDECRKWALWTTAPGVEAKKQQYISAVIKQIEK